MAQGLARLGAHVAESEDGLVIDGTDGAPLAANGPVEIAAELDHRIAMSFAVAGLAADNEVTIDDMAPGRDQLPGLFGHAARSGSGCMTWDLANVVGLIGSALMVIAYAYSNVARALNFVLFNLLNLIGSVMLVASLTVHFNLASMALEVVWAGIALFGLVKAWSGRRPA